MTGKEEINSDVEKFKAKARSKVLKKDKWKNWRKPRTDEESEAMGDITRGN